MAEETKFCVEKPTVESFKVQTYKFINKRFLDILKPKTQNFHSRIELEYSDHQKSRFTK